MIRFVQQAGEVFRILKETETGVWLISYDSPSTPFFVSLEESKNMERIQAPEPFLAEYYRETRSDAERAKLEMIQPLLQNDNCITDRKVRSQTAKKIVLWRRTKPRTVISIYYRYLATGVLTSRHQKGKPKKRPDYDWAIRTFYYSSKRLSLHTAYEMMLIQRYTNTNGQLVEKAPTWKSFENYFYRHGYHKNPQKIISREGLTYYQRNCKPAFGSASQWRTEPGSFQMDATLCDIYLVSALDRSCVIGRPYLYMAVDTATQLIAGFHVGLECDETAVMLCLENAAQSKTEYCRQCGIEMQPEDWPNAGLPTEIIMDKGREFFGPRMTDLCRQYGLEIMAQPSFRPDRKGLVEKTFDLLQQRYKPILRGKGVIEADAQERWATDYRSQAILTLDEFTQILIHCILYLNSGRVLKNGKPPAQLWLEKEPHLLHIPQEEIHMMTLYRKPIKLTRKGFRIDGLLYVPERMESLHIGDTYQIAADPSNSSTAYVCLEYGHQKCRLSEQFSEFAALPEYEVQKIKQIQREERSIARQQETEASIASMQKVHEIIRQAAEHQQKIGKPDILDIEQNRQREREKLT